MAKIAEIIRIAPSGVRVGVVADRDFTPPLVHVTGARDYLQDLAVEEAAQLAGALLKAAAKASAPPGIVCDPGCLHCAISQLLQVCVPLHNHDAMLLGQCIADIIASIPPSARAENGAHIKAEIGRMLDAAISGTWRDSAVERW